MPPLISVLLPVRNGAAFLEECLNSVFAQTFKDFECIIVNDGSTDQTADILKRIQVPRVRVFELNPGVGVPGALNYAIEQSQGKYLARVDADDILHSQRFEKQVQYLENHPEVGVLGSWMTNFTGERKARIETPAHHGMIACGLIFRGALIHATAMIRRSVIEKSIIRYNPTYRYAEDTELWMRLIHRTKFANLQESLVHRRVHRGMATFKNNRKMNYLVYQLKRKLISELVLKPEKRDIFLVEYRNMVRQTYESYELWLSWFVRLKVAAKDSLLWSKDQIDTILSYWRSDSLNRIYFIKKYYSPRLFWRYLMDGSKPWKKVSWRMSVVLFIKCMIFWRARPFV